MNTMPLNLAVVETYPESAEVFNESISVLTSWVSDQFVSLGESAALNVTKFIESFSDRINNKKGLINRATDIDKIFDNDTVILEYEYAVGRMRVRLRKIPKNILEAYQLANIINAQKTTAELSRFSLNVTSTTTGMTLLGIELGTFVYNWDFEIGQGTFWFVEKDSNR